MIQFFTLSLKRRLVTLFLFGAILPIVVTAALAYIYSSEALQEDAFTKLEAVAEIKKDRILQCMTDMVGDVEVLSRTQDVTHAVETLQAYREARGQDRESGFNVESREYTSIAERLDTFFNGYVETRGYDDLFLVDPVFGHVMYTVARMNDLGAMLSQDVLRDSPLARIWKKVDKEKIPALIDLEEYTPAKMPAGFVGAPVYGEEGATIAVLVLRYGAGNIRALLHDTTGMDGAGHTYLVGEDLVMRADSRTRAGSTFPGKKIDTTAVSEGLLNRSGTQIIDDYEGNKVLSHYSPVGLNAVPGIDFEWVLCSEKGLDEAFVTVSALSLKILLIGSILTILVAAVGYVSARALSKPLKELSYSAARIAGGDLTVSIDAGVGDDEIGVLRRSLADMNSTLRNQTCEIKEDSSTLANAVSQISNTASELSVSAHQMSDAVNEITSTVEEVKRTAYSSNHKADAVSEKADKVVRISDDGRKSTEEAVAGMGKIKDEMDYVAESIVKLSEQTQSIGKIIGAVHGLADQSNLLSINASIEAAKAGEYGKGFAVVAQEVKTLADRSKGATGQVKTILNEIQQATGEAVMATKRGSEAVESGFGLSSRAGEVIGILSEDIAESSRSASQIAASSREQLVGIDQLSKAMESIKVAAGQNVDGAQQLEIATQNLNRLARRLTGLTNRFKV